MCTDETEINDSIGIIDLYDEAVLIAADIEYNPTSFEDASVSIVGFDIRWRSPISTTHLSMPIFKRSLSIRVLPSSFPKLPQRPLSNNPHIETLTVSQYGNKGFLRRGPLSKCFIPPSSAPSLSWQWHDQGQPHR